MKRLIGHDVGRYAFNAALGIVTIYGCPRFDLEQVLLIVNVTSNNTMLQFRGPGPIGLRARRKQSLHADSARPEHHCDE